MQGIVPRFLILLFCFCVSGCSGLLASDQPAVRVYWLQPLSLEASATASEPLQSLSVSVIAAPGLDTDRLLILGPAARLNNYASARWPDNIPEILESIFATTLESTGRYTRVTKGSGSRSSGQRLELELREFFVIANEQEIARSVRAMLSGHIDCLEPNRKISIQASIAVNDNRLSDVVAAYQSALDEVSRQMLEQTASACANIILPAE